MAVTETGRAVRIAGYGPPQVLELAEVALAPLAPGELRIRTLAAAVNHTDLEIRAGAWPIRRADPFPYTPGVEAVGVVHEGAPASPAGPWARPRSP